MMELLRRFEADALDDPFADEPDEPDDPAEAAAGDDLERRLAGMDLGASPALLYLQSQPIPPLTRTNIPTQTARRTNSSGPS